MANIMENYKNTQNRSTNKEKSNNSNKESVSQGLISLKEAAKISGYSSDYIGQLIRAGKISGKQVYSNIAWMTTAEAVLSYKRRNEKGKKEKANPIKNYLEKQKRKLEIELNIIKLFFQTFKSAWLTLFLVILVFVFFNFSIFYYFFSKNIVECQCPKVIENNEGGMEY